MKQLTSDLWQTELYSSGMLNSHAYFLTHPDGNVLFYNTGNDRDLDEIEALGGIRYQMLTHRDEAGPSLVRIRERFGSTLMFSELEAQAIGRYTQADEHFNVGDQTIGDIQVIETPGHTGGSVCFFYKSPHGKSYLFTGDTFFQWDGQWATLVFEKTGGGKALLANSLKKLRNLNPDLVASSGFIGDVGLVEPTPEEWHLAIDQEITKLNSEVKP